MSQENVETMRAGLDAFAREDLSAFLPLMDSEIHFEPHLAGVEGSYAGHDGVKRFFADAFGAFEIFWRRSIRISATSETRCLCWGPSD